MTLNATKTPAATPPAGFEDHQVVDGTSSSGASPAVGIAYEPGTGALFVIEQGDGTAKGNARVRRRDATTGVVTTALTLGCVDSVGERGLLGIAFDPDYLDPGGANRYVYLYYTRAVGQTGMSCAIAGTPWGGYNWVVRYHESGGALTGEEVLLRGPVLDANNHQGGAIRFGLDKTLFIAMGDNDTDAYPIPKARDLGDLRGKILRINRDGTIPASNPFVGQPGARPEIWAYGLRNPFRTSVDPGPGTLYIADVGEARWEEVDAGIAGADYGWPCFEAAAPFGSCTPPPTADTKPVYAYDHGWGDSIIGGPVYRGGPFPPDYDGAYFFGDYGGNWIRRARIDTDGTLTDVEMFLPDATSVVDMAVSPAGCLTWVSIAGLGVHDVCYIGGSNGQPQANATAAPVAGLAPLTVQFNGTGSSDPDQDPLSYSWAFGDATTSTAAAPQHTYATNGVRQATLTVNDGRGAANSSDVTPPIRIVVGNRLPSGTITSPPAGMRYNAGAAISYSGTATDPEDGTLPASAFSWTVVFHHTDHTHPFLGPIVGVSSGSFTIPTNGEESTEVFYRISMTVTDSGSPLGSAGKLSQESFRDIFPNVSTMTLVASPPNAGIQLALDQVTGTAPWSKQSVVGFTRTLTAPSPQTINGATWTFVSWSDGGAATHTIQAPAAGTAYTASYQCTSGCPLSPGLTASRVPTDSARLQWNSLPCATMYDVQRGSLGTLRSTAGNFTSATQSCTINNMTGTTVTDATPTPAAGQWFLVRGVGCGGAAGTYNEGVPSQSGSRDAEIAAAAGACP
ncbi:MAG TPA: PQQ-dependent sugar dehydrogenase [Candidatus Polarisedimenticolaceae bacterium]|nr:PQQ-dependent sugar dehydrogenase [Candidatus Polarisedimenticolaceae bacterium]